MRFVGTVSRGIRLPIMKKGDDLVKTVVDSVCKAAECDRDPFQMRDRDIVAITESLVARSQGNYVSLKDISNDVASKFPEGDVAIICPILSRNRFFQLLRGMVAGIKGNVHIILTYPSDEVGNQIVDPKHFYLNVDKLSGECFDADEFYKIFGVCKHKFTGVDYIDLYQSIDPSRVFVHLSNNPLSALKFADQVLVASIHARFVHREILEHGGAKKVVTMDQICATPPREGAGYNETYGLLGSNYTTDEAVKLFPRDCKNIVEKIAKELKARTGKNIEVMVYGDGAFKDPVCGIWELADPVVSPGYTDGLDGVPKEIKLKYIADNAEGKDPTQAVKDAIKEKYKIGQFEHSTMGTTPRRIPDLVGSLSDLTSGSGDKGTPVVYIQGYFDNYLSE